MPELKIKVEGLKKRYYIGHENNQSYTALRDVITDNVKSVGKKLKKALMKKPNGVSGDTVEEFWALKGLDFEINAGDAVGIIGRNGAGKSTLLKILSRITEPTEGRIEIGGRMASLLEVGTGFHPELTGRENIFLNGAILGMSRAEIKRKFDEIVDFSGVEKFLDTPVKRYSSGMYVRLAFAVAAYLESDILIVDEVLAVGDAEFQKKCLGKMNDVSTSEGKTVLFVSHNMAATRQLCKKGILLENGNIKMTGKIDAVVEAYMQRSKSEAIFETVHIKDIGLKITNIVLNRSENGLIEPFKPLVIEIEVDAEQDIDKIGIEVIITSDNVNGIVFASNTKTRKGIDVELKKGKNIVTCTIKSLMLCSGNYTLGFGIDIPFVTFYYYQKEVIDFDVAEVIEPPALLPTLPAYGQFYLDHTWTINPITS